MDSSLTEDQLKSLLAKEWLVKVDPQTSTPYLFKFLFSKVDLSCVLLLTDTKAVWAEVLNSQQFARRWRSFNQSSSSPYDDEDEEDTWRETNLEFLSEVHSLGGISEVSFEVTQSKFSDLGIELEYEDFKWRWETNSLGYRSSAEIISKHLIFPLISATHLAVSSGEPFGKMADNDVEKAVDKVARTARRSLDTHVKHAFSKPKTATMLRRISAMFNFASDLPPILSEVPKPELSISCKEIKSNTLSPPQPPPIDISMERTKAAAKSKSATAERSAPKSPSPRATSPVKSDNSLSKSPARAAASNKPVETGSETEDDSEDGNPPPKPAQTGARPPPDEVLDTRMRSPSPPSPSPSSREPPPPPENRQASKKPRIQSSDSESDAGSKSRGTSRGTAVKRGARQPIKRGGKRF